MSFSDTSETGEIFLFKGNVSQKSSPNIISKTDKSHQDLNPDSRNSKNRLSFDLEILSLLEECYILEERHSDPSRSQHGVITEEEHLQIANEELEECPYPKLLSYPALFTLNPKTGSSICELVTDENAPATGQLFNPERRLATYRAFIRCLNSTDFPFTVRQLETRSELCKQVMYLHRLITDCGEAILRKFRNEEFKLKTDFESFIHRLKSSEIEAISPDFINQQVSDMISELDFWTEDQTNSITSPDQLDYFFFDPASFFVNCFLTVFPDSNTDKTTETYFAKRKDSHLALVRIFSESKFPFTLTQKRVIQKISQIVIFTNGDPNSDEEEKFRVSLQELLLVLNFFDEGPREGISNEKKRRRAYNELVKGLLSLVEQERKLIREFGWHSSRSHDMIGNFLETLKLNFIPRYRNELVLGLR